jgi:hypothetical protein
MYQRKTIVYFEENGSSSALSDGQSCLSVTLSSGGAAPGCQTLLQLDFGSIWSDFLPHAWLQVSGILYGRLVELLEVA